MSDESATMIDEVCQSLQRSMQTILTPSYLQKIDADAIYPEPAYRAWVELGLTGLGLPAELGGYGGSVTDLARVSEELAYWSYDVSTAWTVPMFCALSLLKNANSQQKAHYLPGLVQGHRRFAVCISEAEAGSDVAALATHAVRGAGGWVLNGQKLWSTAAGAPDTTLLVYAKTDRNVSARRGISLFLIENDQPGVRLRKLSMLGRRATGTFEVVFDNVHVPDNCVVGEVNGGWSCLLAGLQTERVLTTAGYVGAAQRVVDMACEHARDRRQFGRTIGSNQSISHMLADMQTQVQAARLLARDAAESVESGNESLKAVSMAKLFGSEAYAGVANQGMQIMGAMGYSLEHEMQRHFRDSRSTTIGAGSSQMQRNIIASTMGLSDKG